MAAKYDFETLSQALDMMKSDDPEGRRKGEKVLRQAACLELGDTYTCCRRFVRDIFKRHIWCAIRRNSFRMGELQHLKYRRGKR